MAAMALGRVEVSWLLWTGSMNTTMALDTVRVHQPADYWSESKMAAMALVTVGVSISWRLDIGSNAAKALVTVRVAINFWTEPKLATKVTGRHCAGSWSNRKVNQLIMGHDPRWWP